MRIKSIIFLISFILSQTLYAQVELKISLKNRCVFTGGAMDDELYKFEGNAQVETWIKEILSASGSEQNFEIVQTNVENVSAVMNGNKRYLLYSLDFIQKASEIDVFGALSHEIGHHLNEHTLTEARRKVEELEADYFVGYIFSKKGYSKLPVNAFLQRMSSSYNIAKVERQNMIYSGFEISDRSLEVKSLPFDTDSKMNTLGIPGFPWPPPSCNTRFEIPENAFLGFTKLIDIDRKIRTALDSRGYSQRSYLSVPNGFALVTQMEQYNAADGTIRNDNTRWLEYPKRERFQGIMDYITSFVMPQKGYFRLFIFVVTNQPFNSSPQRVSKNEAGAWLSQGFNKLPKVISDMPYTEGYDVTTLVYEFEVPESNRKPVQRCPTPVYDARTHLTKAGISQGFGF